jgi:hypothetical protein
MKIFVTAVQAPGQLISCETQNKLQAYAKSISYSSPCNG